MFTIIVLSDESIQNDIHQSILVEKKKSDTNQDVSPNSPDLETPWPSNFHHYGRTDTEKMMADTEFIEDNIEQ